MTRRETAVFLLLWFISPGSWADATCEIDRLLGFIGSSGCTFIRNGEAHDAKTAKAHIEGKYDYTRRWIETAEQFIEYAGTKSSTSGEHYLVICAGGENLSADWLLQELALIRARSSCTGVQGETPESNSGHR